MKLYSCKVAHPAVTHHGISILNALKKIGGLEIHSRDDGAITLLELDGHEDQLHTSAHESVDEAMLRARMEYGVLPDEWARSV